MPRVRPWERRATGIWTTTPVSRRRLELSLNARQISCASCFASAAPSKALSNPITHIAGGGLMMIGGMQCYTPGGYGETTLAEALPVDMSDGSYVMGEMHVEVTEPEAVFFEGYDAVFPPFGAHQTLSEKPGSRVIARFSDGTPFATLGEAGKGRTLALGAIWNHGSGRAFRQWRESGRFVGRCVRWVGHDLD